MKINAVKITSFKSYEDSGWIELSPHFTVLVGQNNAGKSAFLQAFDTRRFDNKPHRTSRLPEGHGLSESVVSFRLSITGDELKERAFRQRGPHYIPALEDHWSGVRDMVFGRNHTFELERNQRGMRVPEAPAYSFSTGDEGELVEVSFTSDPLTRTFSNPTVLYRRPPNDSVQDWIASAFQEQTFVFRAERYSIGRCDANVANELLPDASNLPYMLLMLNKHYHKMEEFQSLVGEVLPGVRRILVSVLSTNIEISVQPHSSMRGDLAIPLDECGTGVAQVLAILYVAVAYKSAQIIIDEPNSFLHPSAVRQLLTVLRRFDHHQFVLSTHSPDVISIARPERLLLLRWDEEQSQTVVTADSGEDIEHVRSSLREIGVSLTDVFGYDAVVFVEGPTERVCFPLLLPVEKRSRVNFVAMREASRLTSAKPEAIFDIYKTGVSSSALLPPQARFSFDRDGRSPKSVEDLVRSSGGTAQFLPAPMYENYLLHPGALAFILSEEDPEGGKRDTEAIKSWLGAEHATYLVKGIEDVSLASCDGARLLAALFDHFSGSRLEYRKVKHGEALTNWLIDHHPAHLADLKKYVEGLTEGLLL